MTNEEHLTLVDKVVPFALGELSGAAASHVREHLPSCPSCMREYREVSEGMLLLAITTAGPAAPARVKDRLLSAAGISPKSAPRKQQAEIAKIRPAVPAPDDDRELPAYVPMRRPWWIFVPAFAAVVLAAFSLLLWVNNAHLREELQSTRTKVNNAQSELAKVHLMDEALNSPDVHRVTLVSLATEPQPEANAMYLPNRRAIFLTAQDFPAVPYGRAYQLWLVPANGAPWMPLKTFTPDVHGHAIMIQTDLAATPEAKGFAITIEAPEGAAHPTTSMIFAGI